MSSVKCLVSFCLFVVCCFAASGCRASDTASRVCLREVCYAVEVVETPEARERGLMFHEKLVAGQGMFFVFDATGDYPFWMKNMTFPIDILWLDEAKAIVHIEHSVPACQADPCKVYDPRVKARYVLEIPAGDSRKFGLMDGEKADVSFSSPESK